MDLDFDDASSTSTPLSSTTSAGSYKVPHVLTALQLEENQSLDARQCARRLEKIPLLAKWVKVEAVFPIYSTLMILSIPMPIWDMLPDHPACSFVGYVMAPKIGGLFMSEEVPAVTSTPEGGLNAYSLMPLSNVPMIITTDHAKIAPQDLAVHAGRATRSHSISSDGLSLAGLGGLLSPPPKISLDPVFIAASSASQIVTNDHDSRAGMWFDQRGIQPSGETVLVAPPALKLVNRFLDQLLFNFLSISRSTSLGSLRPAVSEVLKPKIAKDAISGADQELYEDLGGGEGRELLAFHNVLEPNGGLDLELAWKRTRLRYMVCSSYGDMEHQEEDEDFYTDQEQLDGPPGSNNNRFSNPGVVSLAVAVFLTSVLEYMGKQVLIIAGQAAIID